MAINWDAIPAKEPESVKYERERLWKLGLGTEAAEGSAAALPYYYQISALNPTDPEPLALIGRILLARGDPAGIEVIENCLRTKPIYTAECAGYLYDFHATYGDASLLPGLAERIERAREVEAAADVERHYHEPWNDYEAPTLDEDIIAPLRACFTSADHSGVLLRRSVKLFPETLCHVLIVFTHSPLATSAIANRLDAAMQGFRYRFRGRFQCRIISYSMDRNTGADFRRAAEKIEGAVYLTSEPSPARLYFVVIVLLALVVVIILLAHTA